MVAYFCPPPFMRSASVVPFGITLAGTSTAPSSTTSFNIDIGEPHSSRIVCIAFGLLTTAGAVVNSVTIAGISATILPRASGSNSSVCFAYAKVPSGVTAAVNITLSAAILGYHAAAWRVVGQNSDTPTASNSPAGGANASRSTSVSTLAGGIALAVSVARPGETTWSGATKAYNYTQSSQVTTYDGGRAPSESGGTVVIGVNPCQVVCSVAWR